jgi:hypothetical protein
MARPEHVIRAAQHALIRHSAELEAEITSNAPGWVHEMHRRLRKGAAEALAGLAIGVDPTKADDIRALQMRVRLYDEFVELIREIINEGINLDAQINEAEREELIDTLMQEPDGLRKAVALGLVDVPTDE